MCMLLICGTKLLTLARNILPIFYLFLIFGIFTACFSPNHSEAEENIVSLNKISWCNNQTVMVFMDDGAVTTPPTSQGGPNTNTLGPATGTPVALKDWDTLKANLGFSVFLPTGLPTGSCLLSASGAVRNPISVSNFTLTYLLPDQTSLTITQTLQYDKKTTFQCSAMPDISSSSPSSVSSQQGGGTGISTASTQICTGTHGTTTITFSVNWDKQKLWQFFQNLQPNERWMPHT